MSYIHMKTLQRAMSMVKLPNDLPVKIQRHRRQHQSRLNTRNRIECLRRPTLHEPNGQEFGRSKAEEIPQHDGKHGGLHTDVTMRIEQVGRCAALLRHGGEDHHAVYKAHDHPVYHVVWCGSARVPAEQRETWDPDEEAEGDEVEAEFGLVDAFVEASGVRGGAVGEGAHDDEGGEGADGGEGVQLAELGGSVGDWRGGKYLRDDDCEGDELGGGLVSGSR